MDSDNLKPDGSTPASGRTYRLRNPPPRLPQPLQKNISASSLLSMFKPRQSPSSLTRMNRSHRRPPGAVSYAEPDDSDVVQSPAIKSPPSPGFAPSESEESTLDSPGKTRSDDSLFSNINVVPSDQGTSTTPEERITPARSTLARSTRSNVNYATPKRVPTPRVRGKVKTEPIIASDTVVNPTVKSSKTKHQLVKADSARNRVRDEIATTTKTKRDAYLLHYKEYFLPLLPENNYIAKLKPSEESIVPHEQLVDQPAQITAVMKPYQLKGLSFLATMYKNGISAILGDEMGLGKTLQTLSLIQYLEETHPSPPGISRPYLVVCPLSVLESWYNEIRKWTPNLRPMRFHGTMSERQHLKLQASGKVDRFGNDTGRPKKKRSRKSVPAQGRSTDDGDGASFDILITTYEVFVAEQSWLKGAYVWRYIILDEGHKIKNEKTSISHALQGLKAEHRLLLTGTPLQNNLREMWALLHWLFPEVFTDKTVGKFEESFDLSKGKVSTGFMDDARRLLELIMIRRLKNSPDVNLGLPPKEEVLLYVPLTPVQRFWYTRLLTKAGNTLLDDLFKGSKVKEQKTLRAEHQSMGTLAGFDQNNDQWAESREILQKTIENEAIGEKETTAYKRLLNLVMQLRKCCIHPYQIKGAAPDPYFLGDHVLHASSKFLVLGKIVDELVVKQKKKILVFSGFTGTLDYCQDLLDYKGADQDDAPFRYLRLDGDSARAKRNLDVRLFNDPASDFRIMLISTRAGGLGLNLTAASEIVFLDEDWNPQVTLQAEARAHRIGQTKPVTIYKLCTQGTVEEGMLSRIRKKQFLAVKITESMRDIHSTPDASSSHKRKRGMEEESSNPADDGVPELGMTQLKSLIRRGASTLTHPAVDINEMLSWDLDTIIAKCKDRPEDPEAMDVCSDAQTTMDEQEWLAKMERVETAVLEGVKYQKQMDGETKATTGTLSREDRRIDKNTTVMIDGFAISKESLQCEDWVAVPTMAGKDPRLADVKREKAPPINHQDHCQVCHDGGEVLVCAGCPRVYHVDCLDKAFRLKAKRTTGFHCPQHQCFDCEKNTSNAGGLIYRCRWCEKGFCEDCLDWQTATLIGASLPEFQVLRFAGSHKTNAWYVECQHCVAGAAADESQSAYLGKERRRIADEYDVYRKQQAELDTEVTAGTKEEHDGAGAGAGAADEDETMIQATPVHSSTPTHNLHDANDEDDDDDDDIHPATSGGFLRTRITEDGRLVAPRRETARYKEGGVTGHDDDVEMKDEDEEKGEDEDEEEKEEKEAGKSKIVKIKGSGELFGALLASLTGRRSGVRY